MSRFVRPDTDTLKISDGDTLVVRRRLTSGEQRAAYVRMFLAGVDGDLKVNPLQSGLALITAYLLDWSLTDDNHKPVVIRGVSAADLAATLDALDPESFTEIKEAIEAHAETMRQERAAEKNGKDGEKESSAISPSPSGVAGESSGFVN